MAGLRKLVSVVSALFVILNDFVGGHRQLVLDTKPMVEYTASFDPPGDHIHDSVLAKHATGDPAAILGNPRVPFAEDENPQYLGVARPSQSSVAANHGRTTDWFSLQ
jgi:hypothetical protein